MAFKDKDVEGFRAHLKLRQQTRANMSLVERRAAFDSEMSAVPVADGCTTNSLDLNGVRAERIVPESCAEGKTLLYFHGGSFMLGSIESHRSMVSHLAVAGGVTAVHIDYRLAPENPYPAALEDALKAYRGVLDKGVKPGSLIVGGESAGGNLATSVLLRAREAQLPQPAGLYLISPWLDMNPAGKSFAAIGNRDPVLSKQSIEAAARAYLGCRSDDIFSSPARAQFDGLPPMLIQVGSDEVLLSDAIGIANKVAMTGIEIRLHVVPEMTHAFPLYYWRLRAGAAAIAEAGAWFRERLDAAEEAAA